MTKVLDNGQVEFRFFKPDASQVRIAGDFSGWKPTLHMSSEMGGWWSLQIPMLPGEYRFRYEIDGRWFTDFEASGLELCQHGLNSLLTVPA